MRDLSGNPKFIKSDPRNFDLFFRLLQYICIHYVKFQNPMTRVSYKSAADKVLYKYPKISHIHLSSAAVISTFFGQSNRNLNVAHLQYIFIHCVKFQNSRTRASYKMTGTNSRIIIQQRKLLKLK